jgi:hypothetical protein
MTANDFHQVRGAIALGEAAARAALPRLRALLEPERVPDGPDAFSGAPMRTELRGSLAPARHLLEDKR